MLKTAVILAGGLGTRLRPLTEEKPKPLLPIKGRPMIEHILNNLKKQGVKKAILSIGYKAEQIKEYFQEGKEFGIELAYSLESEPLGTGGAIKKAAEGLKEPFFLLWGDNLMDLNLKKLHQTYQQNKTPVVMALTYREDTENFGVVKLEGKKITAFVEKPKREEAPSKLINAGAFIIEPEGLERLPEGKLSIEKDYFEKIAGEGKITVYIHKGQWFPTDTLEKYKYAEENFEPFSWKGKKVIIADVDGTICESCQEIKERMTEEISRLIEKGYQFAFISGTNTGNLQKMISFRLKKEHHLLGTTGTNYTWVKEDGSAEEAYNYSLSEKEKKEIFLAFEKLITKYGIQTMTTKEDQIQDRDSQITLSAIGRKAPSELKAKYDPEGEKRKEWIESLKKEISEEKYSIKIGGTTSIDVTKRGLDKEWGIKKFAEFKKIKLKEVVFFGDKIYPGGNDYPASKIVDWVSVASPEETLEKLKKL